MKYTTTYSRLGLTLSLICALISSPAEARYGEDMFDSMTGIIIPAPRTESFGYPGDLFPTPVPFTDANKDMFDFRSRQNTFGGDDMFAYRTAPNPPSPLFDWPDSPPPR